jgi:hypothetical protein
MVFGLFRKVYDIICIAPLYRLYRHGPGFHGYGFWYGQPDADVCAALTKVRSVFWNGQMEECQRMIEMDFRSHVIMLETCMYFIVLFYITKCFLRYIFSHKHS